MANTRFQKIRWFNWPLLITISTACLFSGIYRDGFATLFPFLQAEFAVSRAQLGLHSTFFFLISSLMSIITGRFVDRRGFRCGLLLGVSSIGALSILHGLAPSYGVILFLASVTGFGVSLFLPSTTKGVMSSFPLESRSTAMGISMAGFPLGGVLAAIIIPPMARYSGWRLTMVFTGIFTLAYALFLLFFFKGREEEKARRLDLEDEEEKERLSLWREIALLRKDLHLLFLYFLGFFLGITSGIIASHFTLFLYLDYGLTETLAGLGFGVVQLGSVIGRPGWGFLCDRFLKGRRSHGIFLILVLFSLLAFLVVLYSYLNPSLSLLFLLALFIGFSGRGWQGLFFTSVAEVGGERTGVVVGMCMLFVQGGLLTGPPLFGYLADITGSYEASWLTLGFLMALVAIGQLLFLRREKIRMK